MSLWPDHRACPGLARWLPQQLGDDVSVWTSTVRDRKANAGRAAERTWKPPGVLRQLAARWPAWEEREEPYGGVVTLTPLHEPVPPHLVRSVAPGGRLVELAVVSRTLKWWLVPWTWRTRAAYLSAERIPAWVRAGGIQLEQYVSLDPPDVIVTMARRG